MSETLCIGGGGVGDFRGNQAREGERERERDRQHSIFRAKTFLKPPPPPLRPLLPSLSIAHLPIVEYPSNVAAKQVCWTMTIVRPPNHACFWQATKQRPNERQRPAAASLTHSAAAAAVVIFTDSRCHLHHRCVFVRSFGPKSDQGVPQPQKKQAFD